MLMIAGRFSALGGVHVGGGIAIWLDPSRLPKAAHKGGASGGGASGGGGGASGGGGGWLSRRAPTSAGGKPAKPTGARAPSSPAAAPVGLLGGVRPFPGGGLSRPARGQLLAALRAPTARRRRSRA